ncbi:MAG: DUF1697 domain-containing protein [Bacteroidota bacterium]
METYIALLRGINVSGQKKIKMADLREQLSGLGLAEVRTYIQSGNIVFRHPATEPQVLAQKIKSQIQADYGFEVPTLVLRPTDLDYVLQHNPFAQDSDKDPSRWYLTFLATAPPAERIATLAQVDYAPEEFVLDGTNIFFYSPKGYGRAKMNNNFFEQKLKVAATTRNWRTINKLWEMCQA